MSTQRENAPILAFPPHRSAWQPKLRIATKKYEVFFSEHFKEKVANYLFVMAVHRSTAGSPLAF